MGISVKTFDTWEGWVAFMEQQHQAAARAYEECLQEQRDLKPGDHYARATEMGFVIFGEIEAPNPREAHVIESLKERPWLRLVRAFSVACPEGERGSEHVPLMIPLSKEAFEEAEAAHWHLTATVEAEVYSFWERMAMTFRGEA